MEESIKQLFLDDIQESIESCDDDISFTKESLEWFGNRIKLYSEIEYKLGDSSEDQKLREYINRRLKVWKEYEEKDKKELEVIKERSAFLCKSLEVIKNRTDNMLS